MIRIFASVTHESAEGTIREWTLLQTLGDRTIDITPGKGLYSIERPWLNNEPNVSRIPDGIYSVIPWISPSKGAVWSVIGGTVSPYQPDVREKRASRWGVLIHVANYPHEVEGCFGLGLNPAPDEPAVWNSRDAIEAFRKATWGDQTMMLYLTGGKA